VATYASISKLDSSLVRKALTGSLIIAPYSAAPLTASTLFIAGGGLAATLPTGYRDAGYLTEDGIRTTRSTESADETAWQSLEPVRSDPTSDSETLQVDLKETNKLAIELFTGADLTGATLVNGALSIKKPALPPSRYYRVLALGVDSIDGQEFYVARFYPRAKVTSWADQAFAKGSAFQWGVTMTTYVDGALGYAKDDLIGGPGFATLATRMGFTFA